MNEQLSRIFIVEDEALVAMELKDRLGRLGYAVCGVAARGEPALAQIADTRPDLVLLDVNLPGGIDGVEVAARLRAQSTAPVVFLTAYSDDALLRRAATVDPFGYLVKPFDERELHATLQMALHKSRLERTLREANTRLQAEVSDRTASGDAARQGLRERELLLKEIHHRVKNNLQIVSSLMAMQWEMLSDPAAQAALRETDYRVRSMALIHERLYQSPTLASVDFGDYARTLTGALVRAYGVTSTVRLTVDVELVELNAETAVPCGLILNELVCNALKHAFGDGREGELHVTVKPDGDGGVRLTVRDTGPGIPPDIDVPKARSLGLQLVTALSKQLRGTLTIANDGGAVVSIAFKELAHAAR